MVRLPFELRVSSGGSRFYIHAAHRVFHCCYGLHQYSPGISRSFRCTAVASPESALEGKGFLWLAAGYQSRTWAIPTNRESAYALAALSADTADAVPVTEVQALLPRSRQSSRRRRRLQRCPGRLVSLCHRPPATRSPTTERRRGGSGLDRNHYRSWRQGVDTRRRAAAIWPSPDTPRLVAHRVRGACPQDRGCETLDLYRK